MPQRQSSKRRLQDTSSTARDTFADKPFPEQISPAPTPQHSFANMAPQQQTQPSAESPIQAQLEPAASLPQENTTGLPDAVKTGVENLSGYSLDDVRVQYNASQPARLGALAYAQGTNIFVAPGQATEHRLAHEAWHVTQQKQGRVAPTTAIQGAALNTDIDLEHEADTMGSAALHTASTRSAAQRPVGVSMPIIQGDFPDAYNDPRKESQKTAQGNALLSRAAVKLDHMVSQKNLRLFAEVYKVLDSLTNHPGSKWQATKDALVELRKETPDPTANQVFFSEGHLVNMPNNIVPGLDNEIQGAGDDFDPQVRATNAGPQNTTRVEQTALSRSQFAMDSAIRILNQLVGSAKDVLPKGSIASQPKNHDSDLDDDIAAQVNIITQAMKTMNQADEPTHNPNMWYTHQGGNVKKRSADWINDENQVQIGGSPIPPHPAWNHQFTFTLATISNEQGRIEKLPVNVNVDVTIPVGTWHHIYDRHVLSTFGGTIEHVNTFWKTDPHAYLTNAPGITLLETELQLILERSFSFYKAYANVDDIGESARDSWSQGADKFFFQGNAESMIASKDIAQGVDYDVTVLLKSIAPQDASLAHALRPDQL